MTIETKESKASTSSTNHITIFFISLFCIILELFFTRILSLKTWTHVVYIVIPFSILGYGIGANVYLVFKNFINKFSKNIVIAFILITLALLSLASTLSLIYLPVGVKHVVNILKDLPSLSMILWAYTLFMTPFVLIGFLVTYLFSLEAKDSARLYFFDLLGAGFGAYLFFPLINNLEVFHSLLLLSMTAIFLSALVLFFKRRFVISLLFIPLINLVLIITPEPQNYAIDPEKGWEWIPGTFKSDQYVELVSRWHPLGRTNIYFLKNPKYNVDKGPFEINIIPTPRLSYNSSNFIAGTPIYNMSAKGMSETKSKVALFSQPMEVPYVLLSKPNVLVIGAGGGRDIFMAKTHGAQKVLGAEINPGLFKEMSAGGRLHDFSGGIYTEGNTKVYNIDGRHLVKIVPPNSLDLIILNGVDTFSALNSGAYSYAESYLYTKEAIMDYLRVLKDNGIINLNRWLFSGLPRETLRLHAMALQALKEFGVKNPAEHIMIGADGAWSLNLIKKTPFTAEEREIVNKYFMAHATLPIFPLDVLYSLKKQPNYFDLYAKDFKNNAQEEFQRLYPFDISVATDDKPFFFKFYKLSSFRLNEIFAQHHSGTVVFLTQILALLQAIIFILVFIFLPLFILRRKDISGIPKKAVLPFIIYFSCLGCGFMFIEIPIMQKLVLLLGSPIYSITVVLASILISTGLGSFAMPLIQKQFKTRTQFLSVATSLLIIFTLFLVFYGTKISEHFMGDSFAVRIAVSSCLLLPLGFLLGFYFISGLSMMAEKYNDSIPWAWGINCGFSVLGSILSIILAQFSGFNSILLSACCIYLLGLYAFSKLEKNK